MCFFWGIPTLTVHSNVKQKANEKIKKINKIQKQGTNKPKGTLTPINLSFARNMPP